MFVTDKVNYSVTAFMSSASVSDSDSAIIIPSSFFLCHPAHGDAVEGRGVQAEIRQRPPGEAEERLLGGPSAGQAATSMGGDARIGLRTKKIIEIDRS